MAKMARNFWFDAFKADKSEKVSLPPITNAERIANLRRGIEMYRGCADRATTQKERDRCLDAVFIREANLSRLLAA
jgi:hypothetical protein